MVAFALLPFVFYAAFLTSLYFRRTPTVLDGTCDFSLLAWGLFGVMTLGPGRLIIPLYVFAAWGIYTWIFWLGFYFIVVHALASRFKDRLVIYHARRELVLPRFFTHLKDIDPKTEWSGNVLSLHGLGVQWSITCGYFGGHMLFVPTGCLHHNPHREMLQQQMSGLCKTLVMPKSPFRWGWGILTIGLLCVVIGIFVQNIPLLTQQFHEYWWTLESRF